MKTFFLKFGEEEIKPHYGAISWPEMGKPFSSRVGCIIFETHSRVINLLCVFSGGDSSSTRK